MRPWGRAGWWNAAGLGLLAAGLPVVLANSLALGWGLIIAAVVAFMVAAMMLLRRPKTHDLPLRMTPIFSVPPNAALAPDEEINMQDAFGLIAERLGIPMHGHDAESTDARLTIFRDLRQKARDGTIIIRGREQPFGMHGGLYKPQRTYRLSTGRTWISIPCDTFLLPNTRQSLRRLQTRTTTIGETIQLHMWISLSAERPSRRNGRNCLRLALT